MHDQLHADRRRQMHHSVTFVDQFRQHRFIGDGIERITEVRMSFEVANIRNRAGGEIIDDRHPVAALDQGIRQVRTDKTCAAGDQNAALCHVLHL